MSSAAIVAAIGALLAALVSLGVIQLTQDQQTTVLTAAAAILPLVAAWYGRSVVTPVRDPQIVTQHGEIVELIRADTGLPPSVHP